MSVPGIVWSFPEYGGFARRVSELLGWPLVVGVNCDAADTVLIVGMGDPPLHARTLECTRRAGRRIAHWCGPDVRRLVDTGHLAGLTHTADSPGLAEQLAARGIVAEVVPLPVVHEFEPGPFPEQAHVTTYVGFDPDAYGGGLVRAVWACIPDVRWTAYLHSQFEADDMRDLVADTTVHLRLTPHDGGALGAKEYLAAGRRVVTTAPLAHAEQVRFGDLPGTLEALRRALASRGPDMEAAAYWREEASGARYLERLGRLL